MWELKFLKVYLRKAPSSILKLDMLLDAVAWDWMQFMRQSGRFFSCIESELTRQWTFGGETGIYPRQDVPFGDVTHNALRDSMSSNPDYRPYVHDVPTKS